MQLRQKENLKTRRSGETPPALCPADRDRLLRRARKRRAEAAREGIAAVRQWLTTWRAGSARQRAEDDEALKAALADALRSPLTAIRSAAEILRDHGDIAPGERHRFIGTLLKEEARLEALVSDILAASSVDRDRRVWRVRLGRLDLSRYRRVAQA